MNTWEFDENDELRFTSDSDLELEKVHVWIQNQAMAVRMAVINELIARENPISLYRQECECGDDCSEDGRINADIPLTPEQHIRNAIDKIDEMIDGATS